MSRAQWYGALAGCLLSACDDGRLAAFEPSAALGGAGGSVPEERGGTAPIDSEAGGDTGGSSGPLLIDDFEDGDTMARKPLGWWYPINDGTGTQGFGIEPVSGSATSVYALRTHGSGFQNWGAAVGVDLAGESMSLSALGDKQLCFVAKLEPGSNGLIQVHFLQGNQQVNQHYIQELSLSESWTRYCQPLADFVTPAQEALVPSQLFALQFFFAPGSPFAFWLDNVELTP